MTRLRFHALTLPVFAVLALGSLRAVLAQDEPNTDVDPTLLKNKFFVGMAVKLDAPPEALKEAKLNETMVRQTVERALKAQNIKMVDVGNDRQDMAMIVRMGMKAENGKVIGTCEINVIVVVEDAKTGAKKPRMAYDAFVTEEGRSARDVGGALFKTLNKSLATFGGTYKKHNP